MTSQYYITKTIRTENNLNNHNIFPLLIHNVHIVHLHTKTIRGGGVQDHVKQCRVELESVS